MNFIMEEVALVDGSILKVHCTMALSRTLIVYTYELGSIWPSLLAFAMLFIMCPVSLINSTISSYKFTYAMGLIIKPKTLV